MIASRLIPSLIMVASDHGRRFGRLSLEEHVERIDDKRFMSSPCLGLRLGGDCADGRG
jgi:hypothetical protein